MITLYPEQREVANKALYCLHMFKIAYLAMEMRTGKTPTSLTIAKEYGAKSVLFVSKIKAIDDILRDDMPSKFPTMDIELINFESTHKVKNKFPDLVIIDEAHSIGGYSSIEKRKKRFTKQYQALIDVCKEKPIIYLSGTPSPESYTQLYFQLYVSSYSPFRAYGGFYQWARDYVNVREQRIGARTIKNYDSAKAKVFEDVSHFFVSLKQEFNNSVHDVIVPVYPPAHIVKLYKQMEDTAVITVEGVDIIAESPATLQSKLQQIISGHIIDTETGVTFYLSNYKAHAVKELKEKKIAIFYKYKAERELLLGVLDNVTESVEEFQTTDVRYFIGQIQSVKEGVKLDVAEAICSFTLDFSASSYIQSRARLQSRDRVGMFPVYFLQAPGTVDEYVYQCVSKKKRYTAKYYKECKKKEMKA